MTVSIEIERTRQIKPSALQKQYLVVRGLAG